MAKNLEEVVKQLNAAVIAHGKQAKTVEKHIKEMNRPNKQNYSKITRVVEYAQQKSQARNKTN